MKFIIGIDVGTQSVKAGLVNLDNMRIERVASRDYPSGALQAPDDLWQATCAAIRELTETAGGTVECVGLSGQMHGTVLYDSEDRVIGPIINWQDERANTASERFGGKTTVQKMTELIGPEIFADLGIDVMASGFFGATLFHMKEFNSSLRHSLTWHTPCCPPISSGVVLRTAGPIKRILQTRSAQACSTHAKANGTTNASAGWVFLAVYFPR